jgi:hypothetical protein
MVRRKVGGVGARARLAGGSQTGGRRRQRGEVAGVVDVPALASAKAGLWTDASADWRALGGDLGDDAEEIKANVAPVTSPAIWFGLAAVAASARIESTVAALQAAQQKANQVSNVLQQLANEIKASQQTLAEAEELARRYHLTIASDGTVSGPEPKPPLVGGSFDTFAADVSALFEPVSITQNLVTQALQSAAKADQNAAQALETITAATNPPSKPQSSATR